MPINETIGLVASFTTDKGKVLSKRMTNVTIIDISNIESTLELQAGTFTSLSGGTLTFADGSSKTFTPGALTTHNVTTAQAGVASLIGTTPNYIVNGPALVKVLKYPNNATAISHENSPNLIEVPDTLPPNVTNLTYAFYNCTNFNHPNISKWNVSKVTDMRFTFRGCTNFNQPLNNWDVSSVTDMDSMFYYCTKFSQDLSMWCVPLITSKPISFNDNAPLLTAAKLPVWGTCPNPSLTSTASWYRDVNLTTPVGSSTNLRDTYCVFDLKNVKGGEVLELTGNPVTLTVYTIDVTLLSDSSKLTSPIGFNTLYALYKSPDRGNIPMRTIPITIPQGITGNVRLVFKSSALTLHHSLDRGSSVFDFILKHNNVQIGAIATVYRS